MSNTAPPPRHDPYAALRVADFRWFILSRIFSTLALSMQVVAVGWQVYALTNDPLSLGLVGLMEALPTLAVVLYAGYLADRTDRRAIVLITLMALTLCAVGLLALTTERLPALLADNRLVLIYSFIFFTGLARGFFRPASFAFMSQLVPRELYANSSSWNGAIWQGASVAGPALGGLLYAFAGPTLTFSTVAGLYALSVLTAALIGRKPKPVPAVGESLLQSLTSGMRFVFGHPLLLSALAMDLFAVLFGGAVALLPVFAKDILKTGPEGLGYLQAAMPIGAVLMSVYMAFSPPSANAGRYLLLSVLGFGLCIIGFGLSTHFWLSWGLLALAGALDGVSVVIRSTIVQGFTPDDMRGRVAAVNTMFIGSSNELGAFESGLTARLFGAAPAVVLGGCLTLLTVGGVALLSPALRRLDLRTIK